MTSLSLDSIHSALVSLHASLWEWASSMCPAALLRRSVVSDSLGPPWTAAPSGSAVHGISQARILEWAAMSFSRGSSRPRDGAHASCVSCIGRQILSPLYHLGSPKCVEEKQLFVESYCEVLIGAVILKYASTILVHYPDNILTSET